MTKIPYIPRNDSTFVLQLIRILYRDKLNELTTRTATGKCKNKDGNQMKAVTPEKKYFIVKKFEERINGANIKRDEMLKRTHYERINLLINNAIQNIRASKEAK